MEEEHVEMSEEMALRCLSRRKPLNTLVERGGLPISLKNLGLPQGATYQKDDSHHEITVPALHQRRIEPGEERLVSCLPDWAKAAFTSYDKLNRVQSKVCDTALHSTHNMLVLAPFMAGETINVALLTILPHMKKQRQNEKIVYLVPARALLLPM
jgi:pre-mRNA-splicing helicase BRR2